MNEQPLEKKIPGDGGALDVIDIWRTIQGEGPFSGMPATFVRLAGCNLQCPLCDTDYTSARQMIEIDKIVEQVGHWSDLVVLTGGEPLRQPLGRLIQAFYHQCVQVQIETNGTYWQPGLNRASVVCSPKTPSINSKLYPLISAYKYVLRADEVEKDGLPSCALAGQRPARPCGGFPASRIYIQPCDEHDDEKNRKNVQAVVDSCMEHGYRLCLQVQKIVGLD